MISNNIKPQFTSFAVEVIVDKERFMICLFFFIFALEILTDDKQWTIMLIKMQ